MAPEVSSIPNPRSRWIVVWLVIIPIALLSLALGGCRGSAPDSGEKTRAETELGSSQDRGDPLKVAKTVMLRRRNAFRIPDPVVIRTQWDWTILRREIPALPKVDFEQQMLLVHQVSGWMKDVPHPAARVRGRTLCLNVGARSTGEPLSRLILPSQAVVSILPRWEGPVTVGWRDIPRSKTIRRITLYSGEELEEVTRTAIATFEESPEAKLIAYLGKIRAVPAVEFLMKPHPLYRAETIEALVAIGSPEVVKACSQALEHGGPKAVRARAASVLGRLAVSEGLEALMTGLKDTSVAVRRLAARGLGRIGDKRAVPALVAALNAEKRAINAAEAATALGHLKAYSAFPDMLRKATMCERWSPSMVRGLAKLSGEHVIDPWRKERTLRFYADWYKKNRERLSKETGQDLPSLDKSTPHTEKPKR